MNKLNFGCGDRFCPTWTNIDFHSSSPQVKRVNLLEGFPFTTNHFQVVYSSHVLEHFTKEQCLFLLSEAYRVLEKGGILRIVLPDLENSCREYLRILNLNDNDPDKKKLYDWIIVELLDQCVRTKSGGMMGSMIEKAIKDNDQIMIDYIKERTESKLQLIGAPGTLKTKAPLIARLKKRFTRQKMLTKGTYRYIRFVRSLLPKNIRTLVYNDTAIGERHQWMYDSYGIKKLLEEVGFKEVKLLEYDKSTIPDFNKDLLDINSDGSSYKNNSIYIEAVK